MHRRFCRAGTRRNAIYALLTGVRCPHEIVEQGCEPALTDGVDPAQEYGFLHGLAKAAQQAVQAVAPAMFGYVVGDIDRNGLCMAAGGGGDELVFSHCVFVIAFVPVQRAPLRKIEEARLAELISTIF